MSIQAAVLTATLLLMDRGLENPIAVLGVLTLTGWAGVGVGLAISSWARTEFFAVLLVPLVVLPQIMFGGLIVPYGELGDALQVFSDYLIVLRSSFDSLALLELAEIAAPRGGDALTVAAHEGMHRLDVLGLCDWASADRCADAAIPEGEWLRRLKWLGAWIVIPLLVTLAKLSREDT